MEPIFMVNQSEKVAVRVFLGKQDHIAFKGLAVKRDISMTDFMERLAIAAVQYHERTGRHLDEDINRPTRVQDFLTGVNLEALGMEISLQIENLEAIVAGERPSDEDLIALSAAPCVTVDIEELHDMRDRQFGCPQSNEQKNGLCQSAI